MSDACQVPIEELLDHVPADHRIAVIDEGPLRGAHLIPIGQHCADAAAEIRRLKRELGEAKTEAEQAAGLQNTAWDVEHTKASPFRDKQGRAGTFIHNCFILPMDDSVPLIEVQNVEGQPNQRIDVNNLWLALVPEKWDLLGWWCLMLRIRKQCVPWKSEVYRIKCRQLAADGTPQSSYSFLAGGAQ